MLDLLKARFRHGWQAIPDIRRPVLTERYRGFPRIDAAALEIDPIALAANCPAGAISLEPLTIDLGRCVFCGGCERACGGRGIRFGNEHKTASSSRSRLIIPSGMSFEDYFADSITPSRELKRLFGRSLRIRSVSAGGCGACELELNASANVNFDMTRYGIDIVASPRHADALVLTGPVSGNMARALEETWQAIAPPRILIRMGACAISGGIFGSEDALERSFLDSVETVLYIPGCPSHPLAVINGLIRLLGKKYV